MTNREIDQLLARYWNAESTLEEESRLRSYFTSDSVSEEHLDVAPLFIAFKNESDLNAPELKIPEVASPVKAEAKVVRFGTNWRAIAAILVMALAALFVVKSNLNDSTLNKATYVEVDNPEEALEYTKMALAMLSKNYQKGSAEITSNMNSLNRMDIIK